MAVYFCVLLCVVGALGFNVDIPSRVVYRGSSDSMFGFTVQAHVDNGQKMILVGAPEADSQYLSANRKPGAVYRCEAAQRGYERNTPLDHCQEMLFDRKRGNTRDKQQNPIDEKSNQWFGATLSSTGKNGPIVACAPRYVSFVNHKLQHRDPVGACFVASSSDGHDVREYSPCRTPSHGNRKTGVCQAGFSAAISKDVNGFERLFMGAPGSWYWQGRTISIDPTETFNSYYTKIPEEGQIYSQSVSTNPILIATPEASPKYDDSYQGYSVAVGDFAGTGQQGVAVGMPRGAGLKGVVLLYTWELQNFKNISGSQIGAYFGYSLASGDIDGDGNDDVIVGSPMFSKPKTEGFEHGRIYVIYQGRDRSFTKSHAVAGEVSRGRFGLSVASLGDINYDGFGDIAVGAPYGGEHGRGVVYIFQGSEIGIRDKYSQAIKAEEISSSLTTFGFSLSGGVDLDDNSYNDLAVGAYKSDSVVFLKSRPVVKVMAEVKFQSDSKLISLTDKHCKNNTVCSDLMYCLQYTGINVDSQIKFNVSLDLDSRKTTTKRILTERRESTYTTTIVLVQGQQKCERLTVYLDDEIRDKLTPIEVKMTYNLMSQPAGDIVPPVLDQTQSVQAADSLNIQKNCGPDNVCIPDLHMSVSSPIRDYTLGSGENIHLDVTVENGGEDAFEAAYYLKIPAGVTFAKMEKLDKGEGQANIYCSVLGGSDVGLNTTLKCDLGNPMSYHEKVHFRVVLEVDSTASNIVFDMETNSTNPEQNTNYDNVERLSIGVLVKALLEIQGTSDPPELHYNASGYDSTNLQDETKLGPQVIHKYQIKNAGPFTADETEFYIMWPYQTLTGENLMYLMVQPQPLGNVRCDVARNVNPADLPVQNPYVFWLNKEKEAMESSEFAAIYREYIAQNSRDWLEQRYYSSGSQSGGGQLNLAESTNNGQYISGAQSGSRQTGQSSWHSQSSTSGGASNSGGYYDRNSIAAQDARRRMEADAVAREQFNGMFGGKFDYSRNRDEIPEGYTVTRIRNRTAVYDDQNRLVWQAETSTEYGGLMSEESGAFQTTGSRASFGQQASHGIATHGSSQGFGQTGQGFVHRDWATTETVNRDVMNAGSATYHRQAETVVGDEEDNIGGFGAEAAQGTNGEFRSGMTGVGYDTGSRQGQAYQGSQSQSGGQYSQGGQQGSRTYQSGGYQGGQNYQSGGSGQYSQGGSNYQSSGSGGGYSYSSRSGYSARSEGHSGQQRHEAARRKREDQFQVDSQLSALLNNCNEKYKCAVVRCATGRLVKGQEVWVALRTRLNASVLNEISKDRPVKLSSLVAAHVTQLPIVGTPKHSYWHQSEAQTLVSPQLGAAESSSVPLWVVVLAAVVGALLLLLLIFALYKCGFFKRNRPSDHNERQPLNGRDEHL